MTPKALSREIKFRVYSESKKDWVYFNGIYNMPDPDYISDDYQYTGLHDKNGNEIYEGDILAYSNKNSLRHGVVKGHIVYDNGAFRLKRKSEEQSHLNTITVPSYQRTHEIVGNIYEHPHLLTKKNK